MLFTTPAGALPIFRITNRINTELESGIRLAAAQ